MNKVILNFLNKCEGWKVQIKELHWGSKNLSQHKLCDDIASAISDFEDLVSEVEQSLSGKFQTNTLKPQRGETPSLKEFVEGIIATAKSFLKQLDGMGDDYVGIRAECEAFIGTMQRNLYLVNFTLKEEMKRRIRNMVNEARPKNLSNVDGVEKFLGRRPKTIEGRIRQIYRIVKKYGIDKRVYTDNHWQAKDDYYEAITSLGCSFSMRPCGDGNRLNDWEDITSDGGYTDYDPHDNMARSKQYAVKIEYDDGMKIGGYIKFMAAGTVEKPFQKYDTCMVLWPKHERSLGENILNRIVTESINNVLYEGDGSYRGVYIDGLGLPEDVAKSKIDACIEKGWPTRDIQRAIDNWADKNKKDYNYKY